MIQFQYLVFLQSVFPPETFSTEATFVRSFASVCHHMLPEFKPDQMMKYATRLILTLRYGNIEHLMRKEYCWVIRGGQVTK